MLQLYWGWNVDTIKCYMVIDMAIFYFTHSLLNLFNIDHNDMDIVGKWNVLINTNVRVSCITWKVKQWFWIISDVQGDWGDCWDLRIVKLPFSFLCLLEKVVFINFVVSSLVEFHTTVSTYQAIDEIEITNDH